MIENVCSSAQLLTVREEERRRLRRDLHDGLGPLLVATMLKVDAVDNLVDEGSRCRP